LSRPAKTPGDTAFLRRTAAAPRRTAISGLRILAAEDHPFNRRLCQLMLDTFGAQATWAANGREAVTRFKPGGYDAILMDCNMPELDGFEATAAIRHLEMEAGSPKPARIIALTANALAGERERCVAAGMDDYIAKPFTAQQLYQALLAAVPVAPPSGAFFDPARLEQLCEELDRPAVCDMAEDFLAELPDRLAEIHRLAAAGRWPELHRAAHSLKGLSVLFGLPPLGETLLALEDVFVTTDAARVQAALTGLNAQTEAAVPQLCDWLQNQPNPPH
jgi:CheY-like chemotaxis protein/HPt (histidine-containing phosphotransfer) domain-containing protein